GAVMAPFELEMRDDMGRLDTTYNGVVHATFQSNPARGNMLGTTPRIAVAGVARFDDISFDRAGLGCTISFSAGLGVSTVTSAPFNVTAGPAVSLAFLVPPRDGLTN